MMDRIIDEDERIVKDSIDLIVEREVKKRVRIHRIEHFHRVEIESKQTDEFDRE